MGRLNKEDKCEGETSWEGGDDPVQARTSDLDFVLSLTTKFPVQLGRAWVGNWVTMNDIMG